MMHKFYKKAARSIYGKQGTLTDINHVNGHVETRSSNGRHITKNSRHNATVVIPYLDKDTRQQFETNLKWAGTTA
jgi:hypothetical protein